MYGPAPRVSHTPPRPPDGDECLSCVDLEDVCLHASCRVVLLVTRAVAGGVEYHPSRVPTKIKMDCDGEYTKYSSGVPCTVGPVCLCETRVVGCRDVVT